MWCSVGVHFFRNFIKPFGDPSSAVRIADFAFFFTGLTGGVNVFLSMKVLFDEVTAAAITVLFAGEFSNSDFEDAEGKCCFIRGDGEDGADMLSESDSSSPVG